MKHVFIVAEIGCNHNGSEEVAAKMVMEAKKCGVDAVKFQTFKSEDLISRYAPKAEYQKATTGSSGSQLEMTKKLELSQNDYLELRSLAEKNGLCVFSTAFDDGSIDFLYNNGQTIWKIPSGELTNLPYLEKIGRLSCRDKKVILSTGMGTMAEIHAAVEILVRNGVKESEMTILHCNTEYPTPDEDVNILAIKDLQKEFPTISIGFSDHSKGYLAAVAATVLGISMIEKHFTLDRSLPGPDQKASIEPNELADLVTSVRRVEILAGSGKKVVTPSEAKNKIVARKSIVAKISIKKGEQFSALNVTCKRPGNGISPMHWYEVLGKTAERDFNVDELISVDGISWEGQNDAK